MRWSWAIEAGVAAEELQKKRERTSEEQSF